MEEVKGKQVPVSPAFLLAQVGAHAAARFAERLANLGLSPPHAGILRHLSASAGMSQQRLADLLRIHPSRLVAILDDLESKKLVERRENPEDRRSYALFLTDLGARTVAAIGKVAREHSAAICVGLDPTERGELARLLGVIAERQGLTPGVHPGYRRMGPPHEPQR